MTAVDFMESGDLVAGDTDGIVATYSVSNEGEYYMSHEFEAHKSKGVNCLLMVNEYFLVSGGDGDRMLMTWDATRDFDKMGEVQLPDSVGDARTIITQKRPGRNATNAGSAESLFVSTTRNCIVEGSTLKKFAITMWSHWGDIKALAPHPDSLAFVTAGLTDKTVAKWRKQKVAWKVRMQTGCCSAAFHPSGQTVVVGSDDGHLVVLDGESGKHVTTIRICAAPLNALAFAPDGNQLALATQNGAVYVYKTAKQGTVYRRLGKLNGGRQGLQQIDWNSRGDYLMTIDADLEQGFWNVRTSRFERNVNGTSLRDEEWPNATCVVSFANVGAWNKVNARDGDDDLAEVTASNVGVNGGLVVTGNSRGFLRLFRNPAASAKCEFDEVKMGSGAVEAARFVMDDGYVTAVRGREATVVRWKIK